MGFLSGQIPADTLIADKGYDADKRVRSVLATAGIRAIIPPRKNRKTPARFDEADKALYKTRHKIEKFFSWLKDFRGIATRYDKTAQCFLAGVYLAAAVKWTI